MKIQIPDLDQEVILAAVKEHYYLAAIGAFAVYQALVIFYYSFLHPLARFPGPFLAKFSTLYIFKWQVLRKGQLLFHLEDLFEKYGPIVRIDHQSLIVKDLDNYDEVYKVGTRFSKHTAVISHPLFVGSLIAISETKEARVRRDAMSSLLSKASVRRLESLIRSKEDLFASRMKEHMSMAKPINLAHAYRALTADIISEYCYLKCYNALLEPDYSPEWMKGFEETASNIQASLYFRNFGNTVTNIAALMPRFMLKGVPALYNILGWQKECRDQVLDLKQKALAQNVDSDHPSIFQNLFTDDPKRGRRALSDKELTAEAVLLTSAAMDTTGHALEVATFYLIRNPETQEKLLQELRTVMPNRNILARSLELEALPYLSAVIKESLRLGAGVPGPQPRIVPPGGTIALGQKIPAGTVLNHSTYIYMFDKQLFEDPFAWNPDRWLPSAVPQEKLSRMERQFMPFSRGSRQCLGMNLAYIELYMTIALVFRNFELSLHDTTEKDMIWCDGFVPYQHGQVKVMVRERTN